MSFKQNTLFKSYRRRNKLLEKDIGDFRFQQGAVGEKYLVVAYMYEPELNTGLEITVLDNNVPEILGIDITDVDDQPFSGPIYTGQTINCHARTVGMVGHHVVFSLWEDNDDDSTNNDDNSKHKLVQEKITKAGSKGVAHAQFQVAADFKKLSEAAMGNGSAKKQYYITAFGMGLLKPGAGTTLVYPDERKAITKDHLAGKKPEKDQVPPYKEKIVLKPKGEKKTVKTSSYSTQHSTTKKITNVLLLDEKYKPITNTYNSKTLIIQINSQGLINHKVQVRLYDQDVKYNDLLIDQEFTITRNEYKIRVNLDRIPRSKGGEYWEDGAEQELFANIKVKDLNLKLSSVKIDVDAGVFKVEVDKSNKKAVSEGGKKGEGKSCGEKYCIKKGDSSELIREINIRLAGFGGNVPTDVFTERTEKMIKQFQRDYMKVPETGKVCGNVLRSIDEFCSKWVENISNYKCLCHASDSKVAVKDRCSSGYGKGLKDEHPGIHRSLLWGVSALKYYLSVQKKDSFNRISAGYRCWAHNKSIPRTSTNHMGKAVDIQFEVDDKLITGKDAKNIKKLQLIRDSYYRKYLNAQEGWSVKDAVFRLEPIGLGKDQSYSWIHMDVTKYEGYLDDKYFVQLQNDIQGDKLANKAIKLNLTRLCNCGGFSQNNQEKPTQKSKYKWSHSPFGNLIAKKESNDNYNICNKTKGEYQVIRNIKVVDTKIEDIVEKQKNRDVFAVGRYQLIPKTLNEAIVALKLDVSKNLDEEMQDKIFDEFLINIKRPKIIKYLEKDGSIDDAMHESAKEWASIGVAKGKGMSKGRIAKGGESYYADDGLNKAHITPEQIKESLIKSKNEI
jgi:hypothetical protein